MCVCKTDLCQIFNHQTKNITEIIDSGNKHAHKLAGLNMGYVNLLFNSKNNMGTII